MSPTPEKVGGGGIFKCWDRVDVDLERVWVHSLKILDYLIHFAKLDFLDQMPNPHSSNFE